MKHVFSYLCMSALFFAGCGQPKITSHWKDRGISIDGKDNEWQGARVYLKDANVGMGLLNDEQHLYLCLSLSDRDAQVKVMRQGFTVWFDPEGKKNKTFGIRFPLGMQETRTPVAAGEEKSQGFGMRGAGGQGNLNSKQIQSLFEQVLEFPEMEILGPRQYERRRVPLSEGQDIQLKLSYTYGRLVYELKVPLSQITHTTNANTEKTIGLGFETPELKQAAQQQQMAGKGGGMRGGGGKGGGGGMRGGGGKGGRMRGGATGEPTPEPFQLWTKVQLASK